MATSALLQGSGESYLIVYDDMDRSACSIAVKLREVDRFPDNSLARESRIAVNQDGENLVAHDVTAAFLFCTDNSLRLQDSPIRGDWGSAPQKPRSPVHPEIGIFRRSRDDI